MRHTVFRRQRPMWVPPLVFGLFLALGGFPAGLFVYWIASNLITLCRNHLVYRHGPRQTTRKEDVPAEERDVGANDEKTPGDPRAAEELPAKGEAEKEAQKAQVEARSYDRRQRRSLSVGSPASIQPFLPPT